jgi:isoleucyl-tRNA synthetase
VHLRQRSWGVPLPFFLHKDTGELHPRTLELLDAGGEIVEPAASRPGAALDAEDCSAPRTRALRARAATSSTSGSTPGTHLQHVLRGSHAAEGHHDHGPEADLYLEGSRPAPRLVPLVAAARLRASNGRAPYAALLTHGFTVDGQGRKMSKSLGNVIEPQKCRDTLGAEIMRLWVAAPTTRASCRSTTRS